MDYLSTLGLVLNLEPVCLFQQTKQWLSAMKQWFQSGTNSLLGQKKEPSISNLEMGFLRPKDTTRLSEAPFLTKVCSPNQ